MKAIHWIIAAAAFAFVQQARAAQTDPEVIVYRFPGVLDVGSVATSFHCTNFSGTLEIIRIVVRDNEATIKANFSFALPHLWTATVSTRPTVLYGSASLNTDTVKGTAAIAATSTNIICTAVTLEASSAVPNGFALHGIRFSPIPGSQE